MDPDYVFSTLWACVDEWKVCASKAIHRRRDAEFKGAGVWDCGEEKNTAANILWSFQTVFIAEPFAYLITSIELGGAGKSKGLGWRRATISWLAGNRVNSFDRIFPRICDRVVLRKALAYHN